VRCICSFNRLETSLTVYTRAARKSASTASAFIKKMLRVDRKEFSRNVSQYGAVLLQCAFNTHVVPVALEISEVAGLLELREAFARYALPGAGFPTAHRWRKSGKARFQLGRKGYRHCESTPAITSAPVPMALLAIARASRGGIMASPRQSLL
jgi:hypothetical protein